jgi:hypothetical protein
MAIRRLPLTVPVTTMTTVRPCFPAMGRRGSPWLTGVSPELAGGLAWMRCKLEEDQDDAAVPVAVLAQ